MKKYLLSIISAGMLTTGAMAQEPNTMFVHFNDGTIQEISINEINFLDFKYVSSATGEDMMPLEISLSEIIFKSSQLSSVFTPICDLSNETISSLIYNTQGLTSANFWDKYEKSFTVSLDVATNSNGATQNIFTQRVYVDMPFNYTIDGIQSYIGLNSSNSSTIELSLNNDCYDNSHYYDYQGKGAKYIFKLSLYPLDVKTNNPITLSQIFYVYDDSSYIPEVPDIPSYPKLPIEIPLPDKQFNSSQLSDDYTPIFELTNADINSMIYGSQGLNSTNFWDNYEHSFTVTLDIATNDNGATQSMFIQRGYVGMPFNYIIDGIQSYIGLNSSNSSTIELSLNNDCYDNSYYYDYQGKGAKYIFKLSLSPIDDRYFNPITVSQIFYVSK